MTTTVYHSGSTSRGKAKFKSIMAKGITITFEADKASTASFKSKEYLLKGDRIRIVGDNHRTFGGQIIKDGEKPRDGWYSYDVIDYTRLFFTKVSAYYINRTSYDFLKIWFKSDLYKSQPYSTAGLKKTKKKHKKLVWKATSLWDIIQQLKWLDYKAGQYVNCYVNENGTLIYEPRKSTELGYFFNGAYDYSQETDASNIITRAAYVKYEGSTPSALSSSEASKDLIARWGYITEVEECPTTTTTTNNDTTSNDDKSIKNAVEKINKSLRHIKWARTCTSDTSKCSDNDVCKGKSMECRGMSCIIFRKLKASKIPCKIVRYPSAAASSGYHDSVMVKYSTGWKDFDYTGMDGSFKANPAKSKNGTVRIKYPK